MPDRREVSRIRFNNIEFEISDEAVRSSAITLQQHIDDLNHSIENYKATITNLVNSMKNFVGSPLVASRVQDFADETRVYVYTGNESGMTRGNWYYYNGSAWVSGGVYNDTAVSTDTTLTTAGKAADAKSVGDRLSALEAHF
jgi:hypothetical protein